MKPEKSEPKTDTKDGWMKYDDSIKDRVVILSEKQDGGVACYWRKGKRYNREIRRYEDVAYWADLMLSKEIGFKPKFYRER